LKLCLFWKPPIHTSCCNTFCNKNNLGLIGFSYVFKNYLSNIRFQYGVFIIPAYSSPFSRLHFVWLSMI
jgi:hypothetical protein